MPKEKNIENAHNRRQYTIMSSDDIAAGKKSSWYALEISGSVKNLGPELWRLQFLSALYLNDNFLTHLPSEICKLYHLTILDLSNNKLRSLPSEIGDLIQLRELLLNYNSLRVLPYEIGKLFQLQNLGLQGNPLNPELNNLYNECNGTNQLISYMLDHLPVNATVPPNRQWITIADPDHSQPVALFTVMCYNVLCDKYCTRQQYGYCPSWALNWDYRKKGIIDEIRNYNADIISLQEVETEQFHNFFLPELKREGYEGIFEPKSRAKTMTEQEKKHVDGCAIFYKRKKFTLIKEQLIEFNQIAMANAEGSADMLNRVMTKDNIGLIALLETKEFIYEQGKAPLDCQTRRQIMVATAHIHWDPEYCDVKLIQTMMLMWELRNIIEETLQQFRPNSGAVKDVNSMPLLLCGDLNSLPDSGVVEYLTNSKVAANHIDFKEMGYENCLKKLNPNISDKESLTHCFRLGRAYSDSEIMPNTNYTYDFKGIIDYIFYSRDHMKLLGMLGAIDDEWFKQNKIIGCPHPHVPSDHFSLLVQFEMPLPRSPVSASNSSSSRSITASKR